MRSLIEPLEGRVLLSVSPTSFTIDPALTTASGGGVLTLPTKVDADGNPIGPLQSVPLKTEFPGSFSNHGSGTIKAVVTPTSIQFVSASIVGSNSGPAVPNNTPANFAGMAALSEQTPTGTDSETLYVDITGLSISLTSGTLAVKNGKFLNAGEMFPILTGDLSAYAVGTMAGKPFVTGPITLPLSFFATSVANTSTASSTITTNSNGTETLTILASGTFVESLGQGQTVSLNLSGQIVATSAASAKATVTVVPPAAQTATAGIAKSVPLGNFTETGATGPYAVDVNWGDGTTDTKFTEASAGTIASQSHTFAKAATDTVSVTITDAKGNKSNTATFKTLVAAPSPTKLVIATQPTTGTAGAALSPTITVKLESAAGGLATSNTSTVTLALDTFPPGATLTGSTIAKVVNGTATFTGLSLKIAGAYTLKVTDGSLTSAVSKTITIAPAAPAKLVITQQPSTGTAGVALNPTIIVKVEDAFGNVVTTNTSTVALALSTFPKGGTLTGSAGVKAVKGIATFTGLSFKIAGAYVLKATDGTLSSAVTKTITIAAAAAAKLVIFQQPATGTHAVTLSPAFVVDVEDAFGNIVLTDASTVTLAISIKPSGGTLTGTPTAKAVRGVAKFGALSLSKAGTYTLKASDGKLTTALSKSVVVK